MREVRTIDATQKSLESSLEAFSFTGSSTLELEAEVETCLDRCRPVQCQIVTGRSDDNMIQTVHSFGRRRRRRRDASLPEIVEPEKASKGDIVRVSNLAKVLSVRASKFGIGVRESLITHSNQFVDTDTLESPVNSPKSRSKSSSFGSSSHHHRKTSLDSASYSSPGVLSALGIGMSLDEYGHYCFDTAALAAISGLTVCLQLIMFIAAIFFSATMNTNASKGLSESADSVFSYQNHQPTQPPSPSSSLSTTMPRKAAHRPDRRRGEVQDEVQVRTKQSMNGRTLSNYHRQSSSSPLSTVSEQLASPLQLAHAQSRYTDLEHHHHENRRTSKRSSTLDVLY